MTDNEIIKALECRVLTGLRKIHKCGKCKYVKSDACNIRGIIADALDLINRQNEQLKANFDSRQTNERENIDVAHFEAEINRLQARVEKCEKVELFADKTIEALQKENERLKNALTDHEYGNCVAVKNGLIYTHTLEDYDELIGDISAEAYKELVGLIKDEITDAIISNGTAIKERVEKHNVNRYEDNICVMCDGKVSALVGIEDFLDNLLKKLVGEQPILNDVKCIDCEYLELELPYAVCSKAYKGIVQPNDSCGKGKLKELVGEKNVD